MKHNPVFSRLQSLLGISRAELFVAIIILTGLVIGLVYSNLKDDEQGPDASQVMLIIDSIAEAQRSSYIGTDITDAPNQELLPGDTLIEKEEFYPQAKKKELPTDKLDINTASKTQLMRLPGIGPKTALKIIAYRKQRRFSNIEEIMNIKGIGPKKLEKMRPYIKTGNQRPKRTTPP